MVLKKVFEADRAFHGRRMTFRPSYLPFCEKHSNATGFVPCAVQNAYDACPDWSAAASGKMGSPITIGSYGRGTGAPILDGGVKPATWTRFTDKGQKQVWVASTAGSKIVPGKTPVMDVYVNSG